MFSRNVGFAMLLAMLCALPRLHGATVPELTDPQKQVTRLEYFYDQDPGFGKGVAVDFEADAQGRIQMDLNLPLDGLSVGMHQLFIRALNGRDEWSIAHKHTFFVTPFAAQTVPAIEKGEYFFGEDPGEGNGIPLSPTERIEGTVAFSVHVPPMPAGHHALQFRAQDSFGNWSMPAKNNFLQLPDIRATGIEWSVVEGEEVIATGAQAIEPPASRYSGNVMTPLLADASINERSLQAQARLILEERIPSFTQTFDLQIQAVGDPLRIITPPQNQTVSVGGQLRLSLVVNQSENLSFQWFKDGVAVPGATSSSFTIPVIGLEDAGSYSVSISDGVQEVLSGSAMVQVSGPVENAPPTIALIGDALFELSQGATYTEPGVSATDPEDGDLTDQVVIDGQVNTSVPGVYTLRYSVSDQQGLSVSASRTVLVLASEISILTGPLTNETNGNKYYLLSAASWTESEAFARELGGHLATVRNADEQEWIWETFSAFGGEERSLWIGLNDQDQEGSYQWASGEAVGYTHWLDGQPDDNPSSGGEDYVHIIRRGNAFNAAPGFWNDLADTDAVFDQFSPIHGVVEVVTDDTVPPSEPESVRLSLLSPTAENSFYRLIWESQVGVSYVIEAVDELGQVWSRAEPEPVVAISDVTEWAFELSGQSRFFRVIAESTLGEMPGENAIQVALESFPKNGDFAIPRLASISVDLPAPQLIVPDSIRIKIGALGTFRIGDAAIQYDQGNLTFDPSLAGALGDPESVVEANVFYSDLEGNQYTYDWSFRIQKQPILSGDVFVLGSPQAQFQGQALNPRQLAIYEDLEVTPSAFAIRQQTGNAPWSLDEVKDDSLVFSYEGDTPPNFQVGQYLANLTPAKKDEIFYRKVAVVLKDVPEDQKVTVFTEDVGLLEIFVQASMLSHPVGLPAAAYAIAQEGFLVNASQGYLLESPIGETWSPEEGVDLTLSGNISIEPKLSLSLDIQGSTVEDFYLRQEGKMTTELGASLKVTESHQWETATEDPIFSTDRVFYLGQVGVVPIWLDLEFEVNAEAEASYEASGEISTGIQTTYDYWSELVYSTRNPSLNGVFASPPSTELEVKPLEVTVDGHAKAAVRLVPELTMELESLFGVRVDLTPEVGLEGDVSFVNGEMESASVELYGRLDLNAGLSIEGISDELLPEIEPVELVYYPWRFDYPKFPFEVTQQPQGGQFSPGTNVTLSVDVEVLRDSFDPSELRYQWYKDDVILPDRTDRVLRLNQISESDSGNYYVEVWKDGEEESQISDVAAVNLENEVGEPRLVTIKTFAGTSQFDFSSISLTKPKNLLILPTTNWNALRGNTEILEELERYGYVDGDEIPYYILVEPEQPGQKAKAGNLEMAFTDGDSGYSTDWSIRILPHSNIRPEFVVEVELVPSGDVITFPGDGGPGGGHPTNKYSGNSGTKLWLNITQANPNELSRSSPRLNSISYVPLDSSFLQELAGSNYLEEERSQAEIELKDGYGNSLNFLDVGYPFDLDLEINYYYQAGEWPESVGENYSPQGVHSYDYEITVHVIAYDPNLSDQWYVDELEPLIERLH